MNKSFSVDPLVLQLFPKQMFNRREFVASLSFGSFLLSGAALVFSKATQALTLSHPNVLHEELVVPTPDGVNLPVFMTRPKNANASTPIVIVVQEIFGVHDYIKEFCAQLSDAGLIAVAPELYVRQGDPRTHTSIPTLLSDIVSRVPDDQVMRDLDTTVAYLKQQGFSGNLGITGFCWGGRITWLYTAHNPSVKAGVAWYGRLDGERNELQPSHPVDVTQQLHAPVLGLYAGDDPGIPLAHVDRMKTLLKQGNAHAQLSEIIVYPDVHHGFHANYRATFDAAAAADGQTRCLVWLVNNLMPVS